VGAPAPRQAWRSTWNYRQDCVAATVRYVTRFDLVTVDTLDPNALAMFWSRALGLVEVEREDVDRWIVLGSPDGVRRLGLQRCERSGPVGRWHLDLACDPTEFETELARLVGLGARQLRAPRHEAYGSIANLSDPDGNPFDLCAYNSGQS
jgi:predicted enzyme related to lactoylglutathione lyase